MSDEYKIEKGIPIPNYWNHGKTGKWSQLVAEMKVGDSVLVNGRIEAMNIRNAIVKQGFRCVTRGNDQPKVRVWKMEKPK